MDETLLEPEIQELPSNTDENFQLLYSIAISLKKIRITQENMHVDMQNFIINRINQ